jgi:death-on-curing protein
VGKNGGKNNTLLLFSIPKQKIIKSWFLKLRLMPDITYPTPEKIIEYNLLILNLIRVKKADKAQVMSYKKIQEVIEGCKQVEGDVYIKAAYLLKGLVKAHAFASGNRRTAFIVTKDFLISNNITMKIENDPKYARVLTGIREGYYTDEEIKTWLKNGTIREFKR